MLRQIDTTRLEVFEPLVNPGEVSGFKSPAADYQERRLNIMQRIERDPVNTYYWEAETDEMYLFGIKANTILVTDTTIKPRGGMIVVAWHQGDWYVRQLLEYGKDKYLSSGQEHDELIKVTEATTFRGVVTWSCCPQLEMNIMIGLVDCNIHKELAIR